MLQKKSQKIAKNYECITCDYFTSKYSDYVKHLSTLKHTNKLNATLLLQNATTISDKLNTTYACECGKKYNHSSSYYRHKKSCEPLANNNFDNPENLIKYLMKENSEFKQLLIDQNKQMMEQNNNMMTQNNNMMGKFVELSKNVGNNNNSNNTNSFNLNMYLNETCKDALNIMDFVNQLKIGLTELEETGRLGFANGISKIFIDGLKQIDINNRPVHCSDSKRETLYIKSNNEWNKDDGERKILTSALKHVAHKNITQISEWTKVHPDYNDSDSKDNDKFLQIVSEAMSGSTQDETIKNYNKIIKNIVKETIIEKCTE
jgi:hypothetical protein